MHILEAMRSALVRTVKYNKMKHSYSIEHFELIVIDCDLLSYR